eukprot:scaffold18709_cov112-Isochrysis_galbana.AAC.2
MEECTASGNGRGGTSRRSRASRDLRRLRHKRPRLRVESPDAGWMDGGSCSCSCRPRRCLCLCDVFVPLTLTRPYPYPYQYPKYTNTKRGGVRVRCPQSVVAFIFFKLKELRIDTTPPRKTITHCITCVPGPPGRRDSSPSCCSCIAVSSRPPPLRSARSLRLFRHGAARDDAGLPRPIQGQ